MNNLSQSVCYMIGSIENAKDDGVSWRIKLKQQCFAQKIDIRWIDPCNKPANGIKEIGKEKDIISNLRKNGEYDQLTKVMKNIRRQDLRFCDLSDFVVFYYDPDIGTCGSWDEVFTIEDQHKPIFVVCEKGKNRIPAWLFAAVNHEEMFESIEDLVEHLSYLNRIPMEDLVKDRRWVLIRPDLI